MDSTGGRSAIVVPFALPDGLEAIRLAHVSNARLGVPAHVTLLFPFVPAPQLGKGDIERAGLAIRGTKAFDVEFREARSFEPGPTEEGAVWLAPEPPGRFIEMTAALVDAFPAYLPYGGLHDTVIPHLTLANVDVDVQGLIGAAGAHLPISRRVNVAALLVEDQAGRWGIERELPLG
jgi:2'-5' RNA ligase